MNGVGRISSVVCVLLSLAVACAQAQVRDEIDESRNSLYVEFLGNGGLYSINYDRQFVTIAERHRFGMRIGFSFITVGVDSLNAKYPMVFPLTVNYMLGRQRRLEIGGGVSPRLYFRSNGDVVFNIEPCATLGFRLQREDNDFVFRIGFTPLFFDSDAEVAKTLGFYPWFGLSLGRAF